MKLTEQELHNLAMNIIGKAIKEDLNWEFLFVNSDLNKNPQFVCEDSEKHRHFIIVKAVTKGENPDIYDKNFMNVVKEHAEKHNGTAYWAGVGLVNENNITDEIDSEQGYIVNFDGLTIIK